MNLVRGLQAFVRIFCVEMRPIARDLAKIFLWGFAVIVGLALLGVAISKIETHWQVIAAIVAAIAIPADWVSGLWGGFGPEGRLLLGGVVIAWAFLQNVEKRLHDILRRVIAIEELLRR